MTKVAKKTFFACVRRLLSSKAFLPLTLNFVVVSSFVHLRDDNNSTKLKRVKGMENIS